MFVCRFWWGDQLNIALIVIATILGLAATASAWAKISQRSDIIETLVRVGVPKRAVPLLAGLELLGALGLLVGIWSKPIGVAAAAGLTLYFAGAVIAHVRVKDPAKDITPAVVLFILATVTFILELTR